MKTIIHILLLISSSLLISCGAQKVTTKLEITNSALSVANNGFLGGLVIIGKSSEGEFVIPVDYNASGSSSSVTLELPKAVWKFSAVGWAGDTHAIKTFQGVTKCASVNRDLRNDKETVNLLLTTSNCTSQADVFGNSAFYNTDRYLPLRIATCGWLYTNSTPAPVDSLTDPATFCNTAAPFDNIYKKWAKTIKIEIPNIINGVISPGLSICAPVTNDGYWSAAANFNPRLPTKTLPFKMRLYDSLSCLEAGFITEYNFRNGLEVPASNQDTFINTVSSNFNLFIPTNETRKGFSGFSSLIPKITCGSTECIGIPATLSTNIITKPRSAFRILEVSGYNCDDIVGVTLSVGTISPATPTLAQIKSDCRVTDEGHLVTNFDFSALTSPQLDFTFTGGVIRNYTFSTDNSYYAYEHGWEFFGYPLLPAPIAEITRSFEMFYNRDNNSRGILTGVAEMFSPEGAAGILGAVNCSTADTNAIGTVLDKDGINTYRVDIGPSPAGTFVTTFMADGTVIAGTTPLEKRMIIERQVDSTPVFETEIVIDFKCSYKVGRLEAFEDKVNEVSKNIIEWNTEIAGSGKAFRKSSEIKGAPGAEEEIRNTTVIVNEVDVNRAWGEEWNLEIKAVGGGNYDYSAHNKQIYVDTTPGVDRLKLRAASVNLTSIAGINNSSFSSALTTAEGGATTICLDQAVPTFTTTISGPCNTLPDAYQGSYSTLDLKPANFSGSFTPTLPVPAF